MPRRSFLVVVLFFTLVPVLPAPGGVSLAATKSISVTPRLQSKLAEGKRYALIIGIGRYRDTRIPPLRYTVADARAMYDVLTDPRHGRFPKGNVRLLLDERATLVNIRKGLNWLVREAGEDDTVVVYYSGHCAPEGARRSGSVTTPTSTTSPPRRWRIATSPTASNASRRSGSRLSWIRVTRPPSSRSGTPPRPCSTRIFSRTIRGPGGCTITAQRRQAALP